MTFLDIKNYHKYFPILVPFCPPDASKSHRRCNNRWTAAAMQTRFPFYLSQVHVGALVGSCWLLLALFGFMLPHVGPMLHNLPPHCLQDAPKMPQDAPTCPKMTQLSSKMDPSRRQKSLKNHGFYSVFVTFPVLEDDVQNLLQDVPRSSNLSQHVAKMTPKWSQNEPKMSPR